MTQEVEDVDARQMLGGKADRLRTGEGTREKTRKETGNAEKLVLTDHCQ